MTVTIFNDDCRDVLKRMVAAEVQVDSCICDPPYHLESIVKRFGKKGSAAAKNGSDGRFARASRDFHDQTWDGTDSAGARIAEDVKLWKLVRRVMKPGAYLFAFGSPRTGHRMAVAIEDAGFVMHPFIGWAYATGFPKAHAVSRLVTDSTKLGRRAREKAAEDWKGWFYSAQSRRPALEPIYMAQKPFDPKNGYESVLKHGVGAVNVEACRVGPKGNWPANLTQDGSKAVTAQLGGQAGAFGRYPFTEDDRVLLYSGKAKAADRAESDHPTVKPVGLLRDLVRFVTPPGGLVLDPFAGSGTTGQAAIDEGMSAILIERDRGFFRDCQRRFGQGDREAFRLLGLAMPTNSTNFSENIMELIG